jgi:hypothetical protein
MNLSDLNRLWLPLLCMWIGGLFYLYSYRNQKIQRLFLKSSLSLRFLLMMLLMGITAVISMSLSELLHSVDFLLVCRVCFIYHIYFFLCWAKTTANPALAPPLFLAAAPVAAVAMLSLLVFQLGVGVVVVKRIEDLLSLDQITSRMGNPWLWLAGFSMMGYTVACLWYALAILIKELQKNRIYLKPWLKYRCLSLALLTVMQLVAYTPDLLAHLVYLHPDWQGLAHTLVLLASPLIGWITLPFAILIPLDRALASLYERLMEYRARLKIQALKPFYRYIFRRFPATYRYDIYQFEKHRSSQELLSDLLLGLNDIRITLYKTEAERRQVSLEDLLRNHRFSLAWELSWWTGNPVPARSFFNLPIFTPANPRNLQELEQPAAFYLKLAGKVRKQTGATHDIPAENSP